MKAVALKRVFPLTMIVAVLTTILACTFAPGNVGDSEAAATDQQLPFEENEKEFEDKDEVDEKVNGFGISLYCIDDIRFTHHSSVVIVDHSKNHPYRHSLPIFLTNRTLLI
jgi:hypothetical protein